MLHISKLARAVDDHVDVVTGICDDRVVDDAALLVRNQRQATRPRSKTGNITNDNLLQEGSAILSVPADLYIAR